MPTEPHTRAGADTPTGPDTPPAPEVPASTGTPIDGDGEDRPAMRISVVTIFPRYLDPLRESLLGKAIAAGVIALDVHDLRDWATDRHRTVDDAPYGGGPGMVMRADVWGRALDAVAPAADGGSAPVLVVPTPAGIVFTQSVAARLATCRHLLFACGRYEGIDQRVMADAARAMPVLEVSIGDYVLAGGEVAALVIIEAVARLIPGVLGNPGSVTDDSFAPESGGLLEAPVYTRPPVYRGLAVPPVLTSGDHAAVARYRRAESLRRTAAHRPELLAGVPLNEQDRAVLQTAGSIGPARSGRLERLPARPTRSGADLHSPAADATDDAAGERA